MKWLWIIPPALLLIAAGICRWAYTKAYRRRRRDVNVDDLPSRTPPAHAERIRTLIREMEQLPFEPVEITSHDGLRLYGRYYHVADGAPVHIQCHGYRSFSTRDFCGGNPLARQKGHNTLLIDQRAHGNSEGNTISFGINERWDVLHWTEYVCRRFGNHTPILLSGVSMGAATVLMASELPLPENVVGIIADCPYSSPRAIIRKVIADMKLPVAPAYPFACIGAAVFGRFRGLGSINAIDAVRHTSIPILLIHGEADTFVPCEMSREIAANCASNLRLETFPDADHAMSYMTDTARYTRISNEFIDECLRRFSPSESIEKRS